MTTKRAFCSAVLVLLMAMALFFCWSCDEEEDDVGGGGCEDEWDMIVKGEVLYFRGTDESFKAKIDVKDDDVAEGEIKFEDNWYDITDGIAGKNSIVLLFIEESSPYQTDCEDPTGAGGVYYYLELESDNGLAGPFDGEMTVFCGPTWPSEEEIGNYNVESDVTCEDL